MIRKTAILVPIRNTDGVGMFEALYRPRSQANTFFGCLDTESRI
jgi:hypothetical protein